MPTLSEWVSAKYHDIQTYAETNYPTPTSYAKSSYNWSSNFLKNSADWLATSKAYRFMNWSSRYVTGYSIKESADVIAKANNFAATFVSGHDLPENFAIFREVFDDVYDSKNFEKLKPSLQTRIIFADSLERNFFLQFLPIFAYEAILKPYVFRIPTAHQFINNNLFSAYANGELQRLLYFSGAKLGALSLEGIMDFAMLALNLRGFGRIFLDNILTNPVLTKVIESDCPKQQNFKPCPKEHSGGVLDTIAEQLYFLMNLFISYIIKKSVPGVGPFLGLLLDAINYGLFFLETAMASAGICTADRYKILTDNFSRVLSWGLLYVLTVQAIESACSVLGAKSFFMSQAIANLVLEYFLAAAINNEKRLDDTKRGLDITKYFRMLTNFCVREFNDIVLPYFRNVNNDAGMFDYLVKLSEKKRVIFLRDWFLGPHFKNLDSISHEPLIYNLLDFYGDDIKSKLKLLMWVRCVPLLDRLAVVATWFPDRYFSKESKKFLSVVFAANIDAVIVNLLNYIEKNHPKLINENDFIIMNDTGQLTLDLEKDWAEIELTDEKNLPAFKKNDDSAWVLVEKEDEKALAQEPAITPEEKPTTPAKSAPDYDSLMALYDLKVGNANTYLPKFGMFGAAVVEDHNPQEKGERRSPLQKILSYP